MLQSRITVVDHDLFEVMAKSMLHGYKQDKAYQVLVLSVTKSTASAFVQSVLRGAVPESVRCDGLDTFFQISVQSPHGIVFLMPELGYLDKEGTSRVDTYLRQLDYRVQVVTTRKVMSSLYDQMYTNWLRDRDYLEDRRAVVPLPEDRVLHFTREHYNRYIDHGQFDTYREFPEIDADVVVLGIEFDHLNSQAISYLAYKISESGVGKSRKPRILTERPILETLFERERWLLNNHGCESAMAEAATVDPVREVLRPADAQGYTVWREGKPVAMPYYDKQWSLVTPPVSRSKRK